MRLFGGRILPPAVFRRCCCFRYWLDPDIFGGARRALRQLRRAADATRSGPWQRALATAGVGRPSRRARRISAEPAELNLSSRILPLISFELPLCRDTTANTDMQLPVISSSGRPSQLKEISTGTSSNGSSISSPESGGALNSEFAMEARRPPPMVSSDERSPLLEGRCRTECRRASGQVCCLLTASLALGETLSEA